jgi:YegS/Rv2252/BmrU family lipid kinase
LLIINPCSGQRKINAELANVIKILNENEYATSVQMTLRHGHAVEIARNASGFDLIVCAGGDGTLNQVVTGLIQGGLDMPIGYIPSGSTNDYANTLKLPMKIQDALNKIINGKAKRFDAGQFDGSAYFTYIASFGLFSEVSYNTPQAAKNNFGHAAYLFNGIADFLSAKTYHVKLRTNCGSYEGNYILGMISNTLSVAGVMKFNSSDVDLSDGMFEVLLIKEPKDFADCNQLMNGLINKNFSNPMFTYVKADSVEIEFDEPLSWSLDGEEHKAGKIVKIKNLKQRIQIVK